MASVSMAIENPEKPAGLGRSLDPAIKAEVIKLLQEQPNLSDAKIAKATGVSSTYVLKIRRKLTSQNGESTEEYGRQLAKKLPLHVRVAKWHELVTGQVKPLESHALRSALMRVDELIGHVTAKEKRDTEDKGQPNLPALFQLPAGSQVKVAVAITVPDAGASNRHSVNLSSEVIDIQSDPKPGEGGGTP